MLRKHDDAGSYWLSPLFTLWSTKQAAVDDDVPQTFLIIQVNVILSYFRINIYGKRKL